jgi:hypothetical protein
VKAIEDYTDLIPILHYNDQHFTHWKLQRLPKPWRTVVITAKETLGRRWKNETFEVSETVVGPRSGRPRQRKRQRLFFGEGLFERVILDEAHRSRKHGFAGGIVGSNLRVSNQTMLLPSPAPNPTTDQAELICRLKGNKRWMLTATPMVSSIRDVRWVCKFLEREEWLTKMIPPNTFCMPGDILDYDQAVSDGTVEDFTQSRQPQYGGLMAISRIPPWSKPYTDVENGYETLVHCTCRVFDHFIGRHLDIYDALSQKAHRHLTGDGLALTEAEILAQREAARQAGQFTILLLKTLMLRRTMASRIPINIGRPIIAIPPMYITTIRLLYSNNPGDICLSTYQKVLTTTIRRPVNQHDTQAPVTNAELSELNQMSFTPKWRIIRIVSLALTLEYVARDEDFRGENLWTSDIDIDEQRLRRMLNDYKQFKQDALITTVFQSIDPISCTRRELLRLMQWGAPKLAQLRNLLHEKVTNAGEKVIVWVAWPLTQWYVWHVSYYS